MTTDQIAAPYRLAPGEGRWGLEWNGLDLSMKALQGDTGNRLLLFEYTAPPRFPGPPWHVHDDVDEAAYVLDGTLTVKIADDRREHGPGSFVWMPRNVPHAFCNASEEPVRYLGMCCPAGHLQDMFAAIGEYISGLDGPPDPARLDEINRRHGVEVLGPPIL